MHEMNRIVFALILGVALAGCDGLLMVDSPSPDDDVSSIEEDITPGAGSDVDAGRDVVAVPPVDAGTVVPDVGAGSDAEVGVVDVGTPDVGTPDVHTEVDSGPPFEPAPCGAAGFGESFTLLPIEGMSGFGRPFAAPTPEGGAYVATGAGGAIKLVRVNGGGIVEAERSVEGTAVYGLAANVDRVAMLVSRGSDILAMVILARNGAVVSDQIVIGDVDHSVTNNEWFGNQLRNGRLAWTGTQWAAYYAVNRLWPDGIAHYGDQLRLYEPDGSSFQMVWGWGCSHSMEMRISHNGDRLGPICSSDCFPSKGVHFNHRGARLYTDEGGSDCAGRYGTTLGGSIPMPGGFWVPFTATDDRSSHDVAVVRITGTSAGSVIWLTESSQNATALNSANYGEHLLVAWNESGANHFVRLHGDDGTTLNGPRSIDLASLGTASDFFNFADGDVGWAQSMGTGMGLARLQVCP